jgi:hypothetical protein
MTQQIELFKERGRRSRSARNLGIERVASRNVEFLRRCREFALAVCISSGSVTIEDVRDFARAQGLVPTHPNAWGAVFKTADFEPVGYHVNTIESAHARTVRRWARAVQQ